MTDHTAWAPRIARTVLRDSLRLKEGDNVTFEAWTNALPWLDAFLVEARKIGAHALVTYESDAAFWEVLRLRKSRVLGEFGPQDRAILENSDAYVYFYGPGDRTRFFSLPHRTLETLTAYEDEWFKQVRERKIRFCRIEVARATEKLAREYGVDYDRWVRELYEASVYPPSKLSRDGRKLSEILRMGRRVEITHKNGTQLELAIRQGDWGHPIVEDGLVDEHDLETGWGLITIPSGEVITPVDESVAEGVFRANRPTRFGTGRGVGLGGSWTFRGGRLSEYSYEGGLDEFQADYRKMGTVKDRPAMLMFGLNPKVHDSPLYEELESGVVGVGIGANEKVGGSNHGKHSSWLFLRGADVEIDGEPVVRSGKLLL